MNWPLRDLFLQYVDRLREAARGNYEMELLVWAILAPYQKQSTRPPVVPSILR